MEKDILTKSLFILKLYTIYYFCLSKLDEVRIGGLM